MSKQLKKFCNIPKYIERTDPKLWELLDNLCVWGAFRPRRGHAGITFIFPSKETVSRLDKMLYSDDIDKCVDIVMAHVVHDNLPTVSAWNAKKSDIPTGGNRKLEVKSATGTKVVLADGAELELDTKFVGFRYGETSSVWRVVKGSLDHTKHQKTATFEHARTPLPGAPKRSAPQDASGGRHYRNNMRRLTAGASAYAMGGGEKFEACHDFLCQFHESVTSGSDDAKARMDIYSDENIYTTMAFIGQDPVLGPLVQPFQPQPGRLYGPGKWHELVRAGHARLHAAIGTSGGATMGDLEGALVRAIADAREGSKHVLDAARKGGLKLSASFHPDTLTLLNLSRSLEHHLFEDLKRVEKDARFAGDWVAQMQDVFDIILTRAETGKSPETTDKTQELGQMVGGLLAHIKSFSKSPYAKYPFSKASCQVSDDGMKTALLIYSDDSLADVLSKMGPERLSALFTNIPAPQEEADAAAPANL